MYIVVAKYLIPEGYAALTVFPFVVLRESESQQNLVLMQHEQIHIRQQLEMLVIAFFLWYFAEYLFGLIRFGNHNLAYRNISFEKKLTRMRKTRNF
ncbi:hypothetical protein [Flavobacterium sp. 3HN19-14]|uniref:hypothetical protein n=1 Tax=Flavobacterium sp. 3HN19-14 TaxID=3448133 RepID=UPI003EE1F6D6